MLTGSELGADGEDLVGRVAFIEVRLQAEDEVLQRHLPSHSQSRWAYRILNRQSRLAPRTCHDCMAPPRPPLRPPPTRDPPISLLGGLEGLGLGAYKIQDLGLRFRVEGLGVEFPRVRVLV